MGIKSFVDPVDYSEIFNEIFAFWGTLSPDGKVRNLFGKAFKKAGMDPEVLVGELFSETVFWQTSADMPLKLKAAINQAKTEGTATSVLKFRLSAKQQILIELQIHALHDADSVSELFIFAKEITRGGKHDEKVKESTDHLLFAAENAEIGLWYWDLIKDNFTLTPKGFELFGISRQTKITYRSFLDLLHPEDKHKVEAAIAESQALGKDYSVEYRVVFPNGDIHWIASRGRSFLDNSGNSKTMAGIVQAITAKKLASEELSKVYGHEKKARDEAEEASRAKDFFLAVISHELRTPLNAILGWTRILLGKDLDEKTRKKALETIETSARSQAKLLDDLLDSSRVASGRLKLEFREIDLLEIIRTVLNLQKPTADSKKIEIGFLPGTERISVFGDANRLQQVISNLLSNALKFTQDGGNIMIDTRVEDQIAVVNITDSGRGINPESMPYIFRQFRQGEDGSSDKGGLGLGLSIAKILVEKHGGSIYAESEGIGFGSTFTIKLPVFDRKKSPGRIDSNRIPVELNALSGFKILIVDDEADSREVLQIFLEQTGAEVKSASSAKEAFQFLLESENELPDVIISDLAMPELDGFAMMARIREFSPKTGGNIPALALSAFTSKNDMQKAKDSGFQEYRTKPFDPDELIRVILALIKK